MAKHNIVFGTLSGKIGNVVFFRRIGRQVERALVPAPADPRTLPQGVVRARFANAKNLWRDLLPFVGNAWRGVSRYGYGGNAFSHHNVGNMPTCSLAMSRDGNYFPNLGVVTFGGLPLNVNAQLTNYEQHVYTTNLLVPATTKRQVSQVAQELVNENTMLRQGDVLHILGIVYSATDAVLSPSSSNDFPSQIVGAAIPLNFEDERSLSVVAPNFTFAATSISEEVSSLAITFNFPSPADGYGVDQLGYALCIFVERPSAPQSSRYTRSSWVMSTEDLNRLRAVCAAGNVSNSFGRTFTNI